MTYTPEQMRGEAAYWSAKAERLRERCERKFTPQDASDLAHAEKADILLRQGADAVERVRVLEAFIRKHLTDSVDKFFDALNLAPPHSTDGQSKAPR